MHSRLILRHNPITGFFFSVQFPIIEFEADAFRLLLNYLHTGSCPLKCTNIPGLICAAEHFDLPELLQACFHHAKQFLRVEVVSRILRIYFIITVIFPTCCLYSKIVFSFLHPPRARLLQ